MTIWFDMDGTIADLYGVEGWLENLVNEDVRPYREAKPLLNFSSFAKVLKNIQRKGYAIGVLTWGSKNASDNYNSQVMETKRAWLKKHLPSVEWDNFQFMPYGTCKNLANTGNDVLFDDEEKNRQDWQGMAYEPQQISEILKNLCQ